MSLALYRSRVWRGFHWLPTLALPLFFILFSLAENVAALVFTNFSFPIRPTPPTRMFVVPLILALGSIGRDSSSGLLPVFLTRPLRRSTYVLSHWAALGTLASFWCLLQLLLQGVLILMSHSNPESIFHVDRADVFFNALERVSLCFGMAAVLVAFAARLPAFGNIVLWGVLFYLVEFVLPGLGKDNPFRLTFYLRELLSEMLVPRLDFRRTFDATPISWSRLFTYLSNISLWLWLAVYIFNRREVSYASH